MLRLLIVTRFVATLTLDVANLITVEALLLLILIRLIALSVIAFYDFSLPLGLFTLALCILCLALSLRAEKFTGTRYDPPTLERAMAWTSTTIFSKVSDPPV